MQNTDWDKIWITRKVLAKLELLFNKPAPKFLLTLTDGRLRSQNEYLGTFLLPGYNNLPLVLEINDELECFQVNVI
jgi:hypothetical protein